MNYKDLALEKVEITSIEPAHFKASEVVRKCSICRSKYREAIEALYFTGINQTNMIEQVRAMGVRTSYDTLKRHMAEHYKPKSVETDIWLNRKRYTMESIPLENIGSILAEHDDPLSVEAITHVLLARGLQDIATGKIRPDNVSELMQVIDAANSTRKLDFEIEQQIGAAREDIDSAFAQLNIIMDALRKHVPKDTLEKVVKEAWASGYNMEVADIDEVPIYQVDDYEEIDMSSALKEYEEYGL